MASILCAFDAKWMLFFLKLETEKKKTSILCAFDAQRRLFGLSVGAPAPRCVRTSLGSKLNISPGFGVMYSVRRSHSETSLVNRPQARQTARGTTRQSQDTRKICFSP